MSGALAPADAAPLDRLSPRRAEVLALLAKGLSNVEIGTALGISKATVRTHVAAVIAALDVANRTEAAAAWAVGSPRQAPVAEIPARPAILVLPFVALDVGGRARSAAAGLSQGLACLFARWCWFPVIASASSAGGRLPGDTSRALGARLGARFVVVGELRWRAGASWRLTVRLDDARDGHCLWTEVYDFAGGALFAVEDSIRESIVAAAYPVMVSQVSAGRPHATPVPGLPAWEMAHEGMALEAEREAKSNALARSWFAAALEHEPNLVLAHFGLGLASYGEILNQWGPAEAALARLAACADRCIALAPHAAEGYYLQARHFQTHGDHLLAARALETAVARNPSFAAAHALLAQVLALAGHSEDGLARMKQAARLGPRSATTGLALFHFVRGEYGEALAGAESALVLRPDYPFGHVLAAASAWWLGDEAVASRHALALRRIAPTYAPVTFLHTFGAGIDGIERLSRALQALGAGR